MKILKLNLYAKLFLLIGIITLLFGCNDETAPIAENSEDSRPFPDSTSLVGVMDSFIFAQDCFLYHGRGDISERYFRSIIKNWNRNDSCNITISDSFGWLSSIEMEKSPIDTSLVLSYCDSANLACPKRGQSYFSYAATLIELELDSAEHFLNLAISKGQELVIVSEFIQVNIDKLDTMKLNFTWLGQSEISEAYK